MPRSQSITKHTPNVHSNRSMHSIRNAFQRLGQLLKPQHINAQHINAQHINAQHINAQHINQYVKPRHVPSQTQFRKHTFDIIEIKYERAGNGDYRVCFARRKRTGAFTTLVGNMPNVEKNSRVLVIGIPVHHPRYGDQFNVEKVCHVQLGALVPNVETYRDTVDCVVQDMTMHRPWIIYDLETTGLNSHFDGIVEISAIRIDPETRQQTIFSRLCRPPCTIPLEVVGIHHITNEMVADESSEEEVIHMFHHFCFSNDSSSDNNDNNDNKNKGKKGKNKKIKLNEEEKEPLFIGYNINGFDNYFLQIRAQMYDMRFPIVKTTDILRVSQSIFPKYHTLTCLCSRLGLVRGTDVHRGEVDVYDTLTAMCLLMTNYGLTIKDMIRRTHPVL